VIELLFRAVVGLLKLELGVKISVRGVRNGLLRTDLVEWLRFRVVVTVTIRV